MQVYLNNGKLVIQFDPDDPFETCYPEDLYTAFNKEGVKELIKTLTELEKEMLE